jgi:hypothetical protein
MYRRRAPAVSAPRSYLAVYIGCDRSLVVEVKYLSWTDDNLLRQVIYQGLPGDKPATEVRRPVPHPEPRGG